MDFGGVFIWRPVASSAIELMAGDSDLLHRCEHTGGVAHFDWVA